MKNYPPIQPGEINLVEELRELLISAGLGQNVLNVFDHSIEIEYARTVTMHGQREILNRYWLMQLNAAAVRNKTDYIDERYCLIDKGDGQTWLKLFKEKILNLCMTSPGGLPLHQ